MKRLSLIMGMLLFVGSSVTAKEGKTRKSPKPQQIEAVTTATPKTAEGEAVITGTVICMGCTLTKEKGANAQCSIYGHISALKVKKVVFSGAWKPDPNYKGKWPPPDLPHPDPAYKGKILSFLPNDNSAELLKEKYHGKEVIIVGTLYPEAHTIDVRFIKFSPAKKAYTCSMCGGDFDKAGQCPKCRMNLIEKKK